MAKLKMIGGIWINPDAVAYLSPPPSDADEPMSIVHFIGGGECTLPHTMAEIAKWLSDDFGSSHS